MLAEDFGKIEFIRSARARSVRVRILASGLRITIPHNASEKTAIEFVNSVAPKIRKKQEQLRIKETVNPTILTEESTLHTLTFDVILLKAERKDIFFSLKNSILTIEFPEKADLKAGQTQHYFWNGINYFLKKEARRILPDRVKQLAEKYKFRYGSVKIQPSKTRWGSCSRERSINLSQYLLLLPAHLVDYVILHELCHTIEMNHGPRFWKLMDEVTNGQSKTLRAGLKDYHMPK